MSIVVTTFDLRWHLTIEAIESTCGLRATVSHGTVISLAFKITLDLLGRGARDAHRVSQRLDQAGAGCVQKKEPQRARPGLFHFLIAPGGYLERLVFEIIP